MKPYKALGAKRNWKPGKKGLLPYPSNESLQTDRAEASLSRLLSDRPLGIHLVMEFSALSLKPDLLEYLSRKQRIGSITVSEIVVGEYEGQGGSFELKSASGTMNAVVWENNVVELQSMAPLGEVLEIETIKGLNREKLIERMGEHFHRNLRERVIPKKSGNQIIVGTSFFGQFLGNLFAFNIWALCHGESLGSALLGSTLFMLFGGPVMLLVWVFVTLPASAICEHFGISKRIVLVTSIGVVCGAVIVSIPGFPLLWRGGFSFESALLGALNGGLTAAGFSFLIRVWSKDPNGDNVVHDQ